MDKQLCSALISLIYVLASVHAEDKVLFAPTFTGPVSPEWVQAKGIWKAENGVLVGEELPEQKHVAVAQHVMPLDNFLLEGELRFDGAKNFITGTDGEGGHVGRLVILPNQIVIQWDHTEPGQKPVSTTIATVKHTLKQGEWFNFRLEWRGTKLKATVDGETLEAEHERFSAMKKQFWFAIASKTASVRNFRVLGL
jgi:hypothetical protein